MSSKKGEENLIMEYIIFILFSLLFFVAAFYFAGKLGDSRLVYEQIFAKKIALAIDAGKPGMTINLNISDLYKFDKSADFRPLIMINNGDGRLNNSVKVSLAGSGGYTYSYFSGYNVEGGIDKNKDVYVIKILE